MNYRLLSIAESELAAAASWYEHHAEGLGQEFLDEFEATFGPACNLWLEGTCDDPSCDHCRRRPTHPL